MYKIYFIFLFSISLFAEDFFVKNYIELKYAIKRVKSGDIIVMKDGIWSGINITFRANGKENAPIILRSEHQGKVIISGKSSLLILGDHLVVDGLVFKNGQPSQIRLITFGQYKKPANYCRLTNTEVIDFNDVNHTKRYDWVGIIGGSHNRVDHCRFTKMKNKGVTLDIKLLDNAAANYHQIDHNEFSYRKIGKKNGYETIRIGDSKHSLQNSRTTVEDNLFVQCDGEIEIISNKSSGNRYIHNTFKNSKGMLTLRHGNRCLVQDNFFFAEGNKQMGGIRIVGEGHNIVNNYFEEIGSSLYRAAISFMNGMLSPPLYEYSQVKDCNITHNKFINTKYTITSGANYKNGKYPIPPTNIEFSDNLVVGEQFPLIQYMGKIKPNIKYKSNIIYGSELGIKRQKGFHRIDPKLTIEKNTGLTISHIKNNFNESKVIPLQSQDIGPRKEPYHNNYEANK